MHASAAFTKTLASVFLVTVIPAFVDVQSLHWLDFSSAEMGGNWLWASPARQKT
jgi:hypothetical protein